jgi:small-conductance mechanosensitive channel
VLKGWQDCKEGQEPTMLLDRTNSYFLKRTILRAAKIPVIYLIIGITLIALSYIDAIFPITEYKTLFNLTDRIGEIFIAIAILRFFYKFVVLVFRRFEKMLGDNHKVAALILTSVRKGLRIIFILAAINIIITLIGPTRPYLILANDVINAIIIGSIGWIAIQILYTFEAVVYQQMIKHERKENIRAKALYTKTHIIRNIATVVIAIITVAAILMSFSSVRNIGISLLASAGFLTAIVGLAGQKTLFSLFSGLQIALSQPIKIGDIVVIEKETGIIEEITFTYVILKLGDKRRMMVPINYFLEKSFENWSHGPESLHSSIHFFVDYMMPIEELRSQLEIILKNSTYWDGIANQLHVSNLTQHSVEVRLQVSAANADNLSELCAEVREKMLEFIREKYPQHFPILRVNGNQVGVEAQSDDVELE